MKKTIKLRCLLFVFLFCACPPANPPVAPERCNIHLDCSEGYYCVLGECQIKTNSTPGNTSQEDAGETDESASLDAGNEVSTSVVDAGAIPDTPLNDSGVPPIVIVSVDASVPFNTIALDAGTSVEPIAFDASINNVGPINLGGSSDGGVVDSGNGYAGQIFEYIENADFEIYELDTVSGLNVPIGWNFESTSGETYKLVETTDESRLHVMEIDRALIGDHWAMMTQTDKVNVNSCDRLFLSGSVRPMEQGIESPGTTQGQFPVHLRVLYNDSLGELYTFQVGIHFKGAALESFVVSEEHCTEELGNCLDFVTYKVSQNEWFSLPAIDLMDLTPKPVLINAFHLGSSGASFKAQFDNVQIYGTGPTSCGIKNPSNANQLDAGE